MKELSIEEKAHCYDEAIKVANKYKDTHIMFSQIKDEIFPELAESEDEKIRKCLINGISFYADSSEDATWGTANFSMKVKDIIAWLEKQNSNVDNANKEYWRGYREGKQENLDKYAELEKQGEQKLYINNNAKEMFIKALERVEEQNNKGYKLTDCDKNSWWEDFKAYASCTIEQKPAEWSEEDERIYKSIIYSFFHNYPLTVQQQEFVKSLKYKVQSKQEWSEEDKNNILFLTSIIEECFKDKEEITLYGDTACANLTKKEVIDRLKSLKDRVQPQKQEWDEEDDAIKNDLINYFRGSALETSEKEVINWLKSLKDRALPQSKQEWSDVDKDILFHIIDDLKFLKDDISKDTKYAVNIVDVEREINWLKSLRPQNAWKPSDEQMMAVQEAMNIVGILTITGSKINSLYQDLKKLMEK